MKSKRTVKRAAGRLVLLATVILTCISIASAALYHHVHTQAGMTDKSSPVVLSATKLGLQAEAPSSGSLQAWVVQDGHQRMNTQVANSQCANNYAGLNAATSREFRSRANITSGQADAWLWTSGEAQAPLPCSQQGQND